MNCAVNDDALSRCVCEAAEAMLAALPAPKDCDHVFSPTFEAKMEQLLARVRCREQWQRLARSAAAVFLAVVLGSGVFLSTNTQARAEFFSWVRELYESSIVYRFFEKYDAEATLPDVAFGWLPEGYAEAVSDGNDSLRIVMFQSSDPNAKSFGCKYYLLSNQTSTTIQFNSAYVYKEKHVNDNPADIYISIEGTEANGIIWVDSKNGIVFELAAYLDEETMIQIAENITIKK